MLLGQQKPKIRKKRKYHPIRDWLLYLVVRVLIIFLFIFGVDANLAFARFLGRMLWRFYHRGRKRALDNLRAAYPEKSEQWIRQVGIRSFEQLVMLPVDVLYTPRFVKRYNRHNYSSYENVEHTKWLMQEKQALLMMTGHYGNFEIIGYILSLSGFEIYSIARPLDNKYINKWLYDIRVRVGQNLIHKTGASKVMPKIVEDGRPLCFIADQDAGKKGVFVDFFGRKASTYKSIGLLAITYNLPVVVGYCRRVGNRFFFHLAITRIIFPDEWVDKDDPLKWITAEYSKEIEKFIRKDPTQYWWLHRRWKTRPKEELKTQQKKSDKQKKTLIKQIPPVKAKSNSSTFSAVS